MSTREAVVKLVQRALEREPRVNVHRNPIRIDIADGAVVLEGDVPDLAAKKLALELRARAGRGRRARGPGRGAVQHSTWGDE